MKLLNKIIYDIKIRNKLMLSHLMLALIPMAIIFFYFQFRFIDNLENTTLSMEEVNMSQVASNVQSYIDQIAEKADLIAQNNLLSNILTCTENEFLTFMQKDSNKEKWNIFLSNIELQIDEEYVKNIRIYCDDSHPVLKDSFTSRYPIFQSIEKIDTSLWYGIFRRQNRNEITASPFYMNHWEEESVGNLAYIRRFEYYWNGKKRSAYIAIYFNEGYLDNILNKSGNYPSSCIYIIDEKESLVAMESQKEEDFYFLSYQSLEDVIEKKEFFQLINYGSEKIWTIEFGIKRSNWKMVYMVTEDSIIGRANFDKYFFIALYFVITCAVLILVFYGIHKMTERLILLKRQMEEVDDGPPRILLEPFHRDEIGCLIESYNNMAKKINMLMAEKIILIKENNRMEMDTLKAQINPHFLYNTLDMISWYAKEGNCNEVYDSIQELAKFYRLTLNHWEMMIGLDKEIQLLKKYISLQAKQMIRKIDFIVDLPEDMMILKIPQFILQPIVENSIRHGIMTKEGQMGYIMLAGWREENRFVIMITDNGAGMDKEKLDRIFDQECEQGKYLHVGFQNIRARLNLIYGSENYDMQITSSKGEGTSVTFILPYI